MHSVNNSTSYTGPPRGRRRRHLAHHHATVNAQTSRLPPGGSPMLGSRPLDSQALFALWTMVMLPALGKNVLSCPSSQRAR